MRIRHSFIVLAGGLLLVAGLRTVSAQDPSAGFSAGAPMAAPYDPGLGMPGYAGSPGPAYSDGYVPGAMPGGYPPGVNPWPTISPYENQFDQHYNKRGLWFNEVINRPREYFFTTEYLIGRFRRPERAVIGDEGVAPLVAGDDLIQGGGGGNNNNINTEFRVLWPQYDWGIIGEDLATDGLRLRTGFMNPDSTGLEIQGFWLSESEQGAHLGLPGRGTTPPGQFEDNEDPRSLRILAGVPFLFDGLIVDDDGSIVPGGWVSVYDKFFEVDSSAESWGGSATWIQSPILKGDVVTVRPTWGLRYLHVRENMNFRAAESGAGYVIDLVDLSIIETTFIDGPSLNSTLSANTRSHLAGPEVGLRLDLGGDKFKVIAESKFGVMANNEKTQLRGNNIGFGPAAGEQRDNFGDTQLPPEGLPSIDNTNFSDTYFADQERHTVVSPMFEQSISVDMPIFSYVPVLKKVKLLEQANFRAGYTLIIIGNLARPHQSVNWNPFPDISEIQIDRSKYHISSVNLGVHWEW